MVLCRHRDDHRRLYRRRPVRAGHHRRPRASPGTTGYIGYVETEPATGTTGTVEVVNGRSMTFRSHRVRRTTATSSINTAGGARSSPLARWSSRPRRPDAPRDRSSGLRPEGRDHRLQPTPSTVSRRPGRRHVRRHDGAGPTCWLECVLLALEAFVWVDTAGPEGQRPRGGVGSRETARLCASQWHWGS